MPAPGTKSRPRPKARASPRKSRSSKSRSSKSRPTAALSGADAPPDASAGSTVDSGADKLAEYRKKRDFEQTPEPAGGTPSPTGFSFVIQKHRASHLHYDFRLELDGVLVSWAVPKGLSMRANEKRFAARTEDHPLDYGDFEGVIPKGQYGGGTVMLWDKGIWVPTEDPRAGVKNGKLVFDLHGCKLKGRFHMVKTKGPDGREVWLIFKGRDADAREDDVTLLDRSVASGRTMEEIAAAPERIWHSNREGPSIVDLVKQIPTRVKFTNLDKVMYPENGLTKAAVIAYYATMAERLLQHVGNRPMSLLRCPDGRTKCFFQKHGTTPLPAQVKLGGDWVMVDDAEGLISLGQAGVLELHTWGCHADGLEQPDQLVVDIDPDPTLAWTLVTEAALETRERLSRLGLHSFVKTTGGKGLHVVVPFAKAEGWETLSRFAKALAQAMERDAPRRYTTNPRKAARSGKILIDHLRNVRGATAVAAYSPRAREGATVSCPLSWEELPSARPQQFNLVTVPSRKADPWEGFPSAANQPLPGVS